MMQVYWQPIRPNRSKPRLHAWHVGRGHFPGQPCINALFNVQGRSVSLEYCLIARLTLDQLSVDPDPRFRVVATKGQGKEYRNTRLTPEGFIPILSSYSSTQLLRHPALQRLQSMTCESFSELSRWGRYL
jgi:hypothetical protein